MSPNRLVLATALLLAVTVAGCSHPHQAPRAASPGPAPGTTGTTASGPATFAGPDGEQARWVIEENDKPGTTAWEIHGAHAGISGFASLAYARQGQRVTLYVSTTGRTFRAQAFRMGYYQGRGARLIWTSAQVKGKDQPGCPVTPGINMVACDNWSPSLMFDVTAAFVQGDYLIKLTGPGNRQSYVPLTIWDPASTATYVIKNDVFTWQAWNFYGGYDYYQGLGSCPPDVYPVCNRARVVSYDRPYAAENGSGNFLALEYPLVRWAEQRGLDVTYATDLTVQEHPGYLTQGTLPWATRGFPEPTAVTYDAASTFSRPNAILRHVRPSLPLAPTHSSTTDSPTPRPSLHHSNDPPPVHPDTYAGFLEPGLHVGFRVADASAWVFAGTGLRDGEVIPGVVASDVDKFDQAYGQPANDQIFGHSPIPASLGQTSIGAFFSDMTYYTDASTGAGVLDTGTNNWIPALDDRSGCHPGGICESAMVQRITGNILKLFGQGPAARIRSSVPNWQQVTGQ